VKLKRASITVQVKRSPKTYAKHSLSGYLVTYAFVSGVELQVVCSLCQIMETGIKILDYPHFHVLVNFYVIFFYYASYLVRGGPTWRLGGALAPQAPKFSP
jgi:hypothetical protein